METVELTLETGLIGVVADTHSKGAYPAWLLEGLRDVELILHAGDLTAPAALSPFEALAPVVAVMGNGDGDTVPSARLLRLGEIRLHLFHGHIGPGRTARERARRISGADVVVYGHSHRAEVTWEGGVLYLNPGSPTRPRGGIPSAARLKIRGGAVEAVLFGEAGEL